MALDSRLDGRGKRHTVVEVVSAELLRAADEHGADELVRQLREGVPHDGGIVLAVDERERARAHVRVVTSSSMAPVNFA